MSGPLDRIRDVAKRTQDGIRNLGRTVDEFGRNKSIESWSRRSDTALLTFDRSADDTIKKIAQLKAAADTLGKATCQQRNCSTVDAERQPSRLPAAWRRPPIQRLRP